MKKFELTSESIVKFGKTLYRIRALVAFGDVKEGELGGFLEKEENLSQDGNAWVRGSATVSENAIVSENATVRGHARVSGNAIVSGSAIVRGHATISENAIVSGSATVRGNATVRGYARVFKTSHYLVIGPMGSRNGFTTFFRTNNLFIGVACGCFRGNVDEFVKKVKETHGDNKHAKTYLAAAELAKMQIDLTPEENEPEE